MKTAIIIGSGISWLATACYLAHHKYKVQLYEKNNQFGGRAGILKQEWFTFDTWPSWYLMPEIFEDFFSYFWKNRSDYYEIQKLSPSYRVYFSDQEYVDISPNLEENIQFFESLEVWSGEKLRAYISWARQEYEFLVQRLLQKNYDSWKDILWLVSWESLKYIAKRKNFWSYESYVKKNFSSPKLQKILLYTSVFLGGSPKNTPAIYSLINHCDFNDGVYFPKWGISSLTQALVSLARELGVELFLNQEVEKICITDKKVDGILLTSWKISADIVVSSGDYYHCDQVLLEETHRQYSKKRWESMTLSPSWFILYLGIEKKISWLLHHTLFFDSDWDTHFDSIFQDAKLCNTPSYYISCVSKTDTDVAPDGCESVFVFVPIASGLKLSEKQKESYAQTIISHISQTIGEDISGYISYRKIYTWDDFEKDYFSFSGNALGLAHTLNQTLSLRPKNKHPKVSWLYFTGHYTTPGTGMPMVLLSAKLVKDKIVSL